jgi:outer membrane protein assembly factor BamB
MVVKWRYEGLARMLYPMMLADGRLYLAQSAGIMTVLEASTGTPIWSETVGEYYEVSTPQVADGIIYFSTNDRPGSTIQAVTASSGEELWRFAPETAGVTVVAAENGVLYAGAEGALYAFDATTGDVLWNTEPLGIGYDAQPVLSGSTVLIRNYEGYLVALAIETGTELWRVFIGEGRGAPLVAENRVYSSGGEHFHALNHEDGSVVWQTALGGGSRQSSLVDTAIYCDVGNTLYNLDITTGEIRWSFSSGLENLFDSHAAAEGAVYVAGENLYALNALDGHEQWRYPLDTSNMIHSTHLTVGDRRIFLTYNVSTLLAIGNLDQPRLLADVTLRGTPSSSGLDRGQAFAGDEIGRIGERHERDGQVWVEVSIGDVQGWIPLDAIDPLTLPPEGEIEYVYMPD